MRIGFDLGSPETSTTTASATKRGDRKGGKTEAAECPLGGLSVEMDAEIDRRFQLPAGLKLVVLVSRYPIR